MTQYKRYWLGTAALSAALLLPSASDAADQTYRFDIPAESVSQALADFSQVSSQQIIFSDDLLKGRKSPGLHGTYTSAAALHALVAGTDLVVEISHDGVLMVQPKNAEAASNDGAAYRDGLETVVVTGTNIRGIVTPVSPLFQYDRQDIESSGYTNTQQFIRSIPQNFAGGALGASDDGAVGPGAQAGNNIEHANGINLRGLGENSTLTLLDGHRLAPSAFGGVVDISTIPIALVDRIDVVADGASAIYGSDAVGGVVNFVLKSDFNGNESYVDFGTVTSGGLEEHVVGQISGKSWDTGSAMVALEYHDKGELSVQDRSFTANAPVPTDLISPLTRYSVVANGHQEILQNLEVYGDLIVSRENTMATLTYFPGVTLSNFVDSLSQSYTFGAKYRPFGDWLVDLSENFSKQDTSEGTLVYPGPAQLGVHNLFFNDTIPTTELRADGSLFDIGGGAVKLAVGLSYRTESADNIITDPNSPLREGFDRSTIAEYGELFIPLVGEQNAIPYVRTLSASLAVRHDHYSDFGDTTNPKLGVVWSPFTGLNVRGSWGTSFRAPDTEELLGQHGANSNIVFNESFANPDGAGTVPVLVLGGTDQNLVPEKARTWSVGFDWLPLDNTKLTFDYYTVNFRDRIIEPPYDPTALLHPSVYGSLITPLANDAAAEEFLAAQVARGAVFIDELGTGTNGVRAAYDYRKHNASSVYQSGFDITASNALSWRGDTITSSLNIAVINEIESQFAPGSTPTDLVNTISNPLAFRLRGGVDWLHGEWRASAAINFSNAYEDNDAIPAASVSAFTTIDARLEYAPHEIAGVDGLSASVSVTNLFDTSPPFVAEDGGALPGVNYDVGNADPLGRFVSIELKKTW